mmetsp:Transcript_18239/g.27702  ORF Transcript_18239/g.27702 Transcript_18239/m.27702 type:complete len:264 (-) Transcript_18239:1306-2097(-)
MSSNPTSKNLFGNETSPDQTNLSLTATPQRGLDAMAVVTQSQGTQSPRMEYLISTMEKHSSDSPMRVDDVNTIHDSYTDDAMPAQVPASGGFLSFPDDGVEIQSPTKKDLKSSYNEPSQKRQIDSSQLVDSNSAARKRQKVRAIPDKKLCIYLRASRIAMAKSLLAEKKNGLFTHGSIKSALNQWKDATVITWKPFDKLGLDSAPVAMEWNDRRLLLEDFMMLQPGDEVKCFKMLLQVNIVALVFNCEHFSHFEGIIKHFLAI